MHQGCVAGASEGREGADGVVADIAKLSVGREAYYTRELATDHQAYLSGHGGVPGRWQGSVKVAVCTQCPGIPAAGTYLPTWINAAIWRWLVMWASDE